ncbi:MAG: FecR domain-containing protein [Chitinophagaceae bacterium]|nr:FecR domain-containing protein [Chitinophagaceae bacterium]
MINTDYYKRLTDVELAADEYFQQWVLLPNEETNVFFTSFITDFPEEEKKIINAGKLVQELGNKSAHIPYLTSREKVFLKSIIYRELGFSDLVEVPAKKEIVNNWGWASLAAASLFIIILVIVFLPNQGKKQLPVISVVSTAPKQIKEVILPDSSVVILNGASSIRFSSNFSTVAVREVILEGNAFFNVKRKVTNTPFIVHANELDIHVTGTEFNVNARSKQTDIVLASGKVNVTLKGDKTKTANIVGGQMVKLDTLNNTLLTNNANIELYTAAWQNKEWHFEETTLKTVADFIKEYYGMDVVFGKEELKQLTITAVVSVNDFSTLVSILEKTLNIRIQTKNQQLIIN